MKFRSIILLTQVVVCFALVRCKSPQARIGQPANLAVNITPERVQRGDYLANHVAVCMDCHSRRDHSQFAGPIIPGTHGAGGEVFDKKMGLPGTFYGKNLTPATLKNWTDGELYRAITTGVSKDGTALLPMMPYLNYGKMDREDIVSIIAYLRTVPSIENTVPASKPDFWLKPILKKMPQKSEPQAKPALQDSIGYGKYLVTFAGCGDCHTKRRMGLSVKKKAFAGGLAFPLSGGTVQSANLTPDLKTGLGHWTKEAFIARFKAFDPETFNSFETQGGFNTPMPWLFYGGMNEEDLGAIYSYLQSLTPIENQTVTFKPKASETKPDLASQLSGDYAIDQLEVFDKKMDTVRDVEGVVSISKINALRVKLTIDIRPKHAEPTPVETICSLLHKQNKVQLIEITTNEVIGYISKREIHLQSKELNGAKTKIVGKL
ncbi:c-type cytochrome [Runella sp.]|uniref:c-type cytochrome n=1 Tax=Runella sp. TaxID=1960881 RepID=UPI003D0C3F62